MPSFLTTMSKLHDAAMYGRIEDLEAMFKSGIDMESSDPSVSPAGPHPSKLSWAPLNLLDASSSTSVMSAAYWGKLESVKFLLSKGVPINAKDQQNRNALHKAAFNANFDVCEFLVMNGCDLYAIDIHGKTPIDLYGISVYPRLNHVDLASKIDILKAKALATSTRDCLN
jgi:ankyrin repeat protein